VPHGYQNDLRERGRKGACCRTWILWDEVFELFNGSAERWKTGVFDMKRIQLERLPSNVYVCKAWKLNRRTTRTLEKD
jgi:hypothetical protein